MKLSKLFSIFVLSICLSSSGFAFVGTETLPRPLPDRPLPAEPVPPRSEPETPREQPSPPPAQEEPEIVSYSFGKTELSTYTRKSYQYMLHPAIGSLMEIRIYGLEDNVEIKAVRIYSSNIYLVREVEELTGDLRYGFTRIARMNPSLIERIEVVASASSLWKRPGSFRLDITTMKNR